MIFRGYDERIPEVRNKREVRRAAIRARPTTTTQRNRPLVAKTEGYKMIIDRLRKDASFLKVLTKAPGWHKAYLIDQAEVDKISATMTEAALTIEALEARIAALEVPK